MCVCVCVCACVFACMSVLMCVGGKPEMNETGASGSQPERTGTREPKNSKSAKKLTYMPTNNKLQSQKAADAHWFHAPRKALHGKNHYYISINVFAW